ncbi:M56 family metallopeptidase [Dyadobacter sp. LHD-138]|uniref:M56 family metallopeptidase n=1 Tax=Dyadobacter sp. LHD-138 TaxID=3071413 RepID=UPI0027DF4412|nr:M56 family metallopeptidase [Dyadobacter sp. LHD-138]MDQ6480727.1 M56 family metallopeptidase [Dyadobacter sp. LHD-138]
MTSYLIKSLLCSGLLLLFYHLFLEKEKMFFFNRFYLLFSIIFVLGIPFLRIELNPEKLPDEVHPYAQTDFLKTDILPVKIPDQTTYKEEQNDSAHDLPRLIYSLITCILLVRFLINLHSVLLQKHGKQMIRYKKTMLVLVPENTITYTFLNHIFVNKDEFLNRQIPEEILTHEYAHVRQKHTLDVLFTELVQVFFWFNPFFFYFKKAMRLNHEFLADEAALAIAQDPGSYKILLLDKILSGTRTNLTSSFNYSITKKRLTMMTRTANPSQNLIKQTVSFFLILGLGFTFCEKIYSQKTEANPEEKPAKTRTELKTGNGLSQELLNEFTETIKKHTRYTKEKQPYNEIYELTAEQKERLFYLYSNMSSEQQKGSIIDIYQSAIPVKKIRSAELFEKWKNPNVFGVWLNGKKINNKELGNYKYTDIVESEIHNLYGAAKKGRIYKYQLELTTNDFFDKTYPERMKDRVHIRQRIVRK